MRLEYEGLHQTEAISLPGSRFFQDPEGYALERYAYYVCYRCNKVTNRLPSSRNSILDSYLIVLLYRPIMVVKLVAKRDWHRKAEVPVVVSHLIRWNWFVEDAVMCHGHKCVQDMELITSNTSADIVVR